MRRLGDMPKGNACRAHGLPLVSIVSCELAWPRCTELVWLLSSRRKGGQDELCARAHERSRSTRPILKSNVYTVTARRTPWSASQSASTRMTRV